MRKKRSWRIALSVLLIGLLLAELLPITGIAQNDSENEVIVSFDMPVTEIIVPLGTENEDIPLPETLAATLGEGTAVDIPVTWEDSGVYNKEAAGTYLFTADIGTWIYAQARPIAVVTVVPQGIHISGKLWLDKSGDGIRDADETGISGYPVTLYAEADLNTPVQTTFTKADGGYRFEGMEPGSYVVRVTSETIGETEYLLPQTITNDNKFAMEEDAVASWSVPLEIGEDEAVTGIDAGMRLSVGIMPLSEIEVSDFTQIANAINSAQSGNEIIIVIKNDIVFPDALVIKKDLKITFKTDEGVNPVKLFSAVGQRHFIIDNKATINVKLIFINIVLDGGNTGGGISASGDFVLEGAEITNCKESGSGGGVNTSTLVNSITLRNCKIHHNTAETLGGGVCVIGADLEIVNCEISYNTSANGQGGGGVFYTRSISRSTSLSIQGSSIHDNKSGMWGGGVFAVIGDNNEIRDSDIYNNIGQEGGGIYMVQHPYSSNWSFEIVGNTIIANNTANKGGGIYTTDLDKLIVSEEVKFENNTASVAAHPFQNMINEYPNIKTTSNSIYGHPLNNCDINVLVVTVSKTVKGDYADKTKEFLFTICFTDSDGKPLSMENDGLGSDEPLTLNDKGEYSFPLKHDDEISFAAVSKYKVQVRESVDSNYKVYHGEELLQQTDDSWVTDEITLNDEDIDFKIINSRNEVVPTGVLIENLQGPVLLALSMLLLMGITGVGMIHSRRKRGL